jgi:hypothetical protein
MSREGPTPHGQRGGFPGQGAEGDPVRHGAGFVIFAPLGNAEAETCAQGDRTYPQMNSVNLKSNRGSSLVRGQPSIHPLLSPS